MLPSLQNLSLDTEVDAIKRGRDPEAGPKPGWYARRDAFKKIKGTPKATEGLHLEDLKGYLARVYSEYKFAWENPGQTRDRGVFAEPGDEQHSTRFVGNKYFSHRLTFQYAFESEPRNPSHGIRTDMELF